MPLVDCFLLEWSGWRVPAGLEQVVSACGQLSVGHTLTCGVPQRSVLSPLLFSRSTLLPWPPSSDSMTSAVIFLGMALSSTLSSSSLTTPRGPRPSREWSHVLPWCVPGCTDTCWTMRKQNWLSSAPGLWPSIGFPTPLPAAMHRLRRTNAAQI